MFFALFWGVTSIISIFLERISPQVPMVPMVWMIVMFDC